MCVEAAAEAVKLNCRILGVGKTVNYISKWCSFYVQNFLSSAAGLSIKSPPPCAWWLRVLSVGPGRQAFPGLREALIVLYLRGATDLARTACRFLQSLVMFVFGFAGWLNRCSKPRKSAHFLRLLIRMISLVFAVGCRCLHRRPCKSPGRDRAALDQADSRVELSGPQDAPVWHFASPRVGRQWWQLCCHGRKEIWPRKGPGKLRDTYHRHG